MDYRKWTAALFLVTLTLFLVGRVQGQASKVKVRFVLGKYAADEDAGTMNVSLNASGLPDLNCESPVDVTVGLANVDFDATPFDLSSGGGDFILDVATLSNDPFTVTFQPNSEVSSSHVINLIGDNLYEGPESFYLEIMNISASKLCAGRIEIDTPSRVQVEIEDNDVLEVNFTNTQLLIREGEKANITAQAHRSPFERPPKIRFSCFELESNSSLQPAYKNKDFKHRRRGYKIKFDKINTQPPVISAPVKIRTIDDDIAEVTESFICALRLSVKPGNPLRAISPDTVIISIIDNDNLSISWEMSSYHVLESDRLVVVSLVASNRFKMKFTVSGRPEEIDMEGNDIVVNGTRYSPANKVEDFKDVDDVVFKFKPKSLVATNTFEVVDDDVLEEDEVFQGTFEIPSIIGRQLPVMAVDPNLTYIIIQDDDNVMVDFVDTNYTCDISESEGSVNVSIMLKGKHAIPLNVTVECVEEATSDDEDSVIIREVINFPANIKGDMSTSNPRGITIPTDSCTSTPEERGYFVCRIVNPSHPRIVTGEQVHVFFTDDNDDGDHGDDD